MPIYEYRCRPCGRTFTVLTLRASEKTEPECPRCASRDADRLLSRFAMPKSEQARLDALSDPSRLGDVDHDDPRSVSRWMRKMGREIGDDLGGGADFEETMDELESGGGDEEE